MKKYLYPGILLIALCAGPVCCLAQSENWTIITSGKDTLRSYRIDSVRGRLVHLSRRRVDVRIPVDSVQYLIQEKESKVWTGAEYGALAGAAAYGIVIAIVGRGSGVGFYIVVGVIVGALYGSILGGVIGAFFGIDSEYDLSEMSMEEKIKLLNDFSLKPDE